MKSKLKLVAVVIALVLCFAGSIKILQHDLSQGPLSADAITGGRLSEMLAYEQFGDFVADTEVPEGVPLRFDGPHIVYRPLGNYGCVAMKNPFIARNKNGDELFSITKVPGHRIVKVIVDGQSELYTYDILPTT